MGLLFTITAGPRQRSHSQIRVPRDSWPYFTVSDSRLPPTWRARSQYLYPPGTGWPSYTPRHWIPFCRLLMICRATVEVFELAPTRSNTRCPNCFLITPFHGPSRKYRFQQCLYCCMLFQSRSVATTVSRAPHFLLWANTPQWFSVLFHTFCILCLYFGISHLAGR
jgi:hypothetical protein